MIWIAIPVAIICYFGRGYLARLLFAKDAPEIALIFGFLTAAIFFRIIYALLSRWFYAQKDTYTPLIISVIAIALNIVLAYNLSQPDSYGVEGLALAQSIVAGVEVVILCGIMLWRDFKLLDREFFNGVVKVIAASGISIVAGYIMISFLPLSLGDRGIVTLGTKFTIIAFVTATVHVFVSRLFGLEEVKPVFRWIKRIILRPIKLQY